MGVAPIVWSDKYSVGIAEVDAQHKRLVELLNDFQSAMARGAGRMAVVRVVDELIQYTMSHFAAEEQFMRTLKYPASDRHKAEHDCLLAQVRSFQAGAASGGAVITVDLLNFLWNWLQTHIMESDQAIGRHAGRSAGAPAMSAI